MLNLLRLDVGSSLLRWGSSSCGVAACASTRQ